MSVRLGYLGCFAYVPPSPGRAAAARMFAPAIGVPEDITNANGVGCVAAHLLSMLNGGAVGAVAEVEVDQGDVLGFPGTVLAAATSGSTGIRVRVGGVVALPGCP